MPAKYPVNDFSIFLLIVIEELLELGTFLSWLTDKATVILRPLLLIAAWENEKFVMNTNNRQQTSGRIIFVLKF